MKLGLVSDIHARYLAPENRIDDNFFEDVVLGKVRNILQIAKDRGCAAIAQAGDLWDNPNPTRYVVSKVMRLLLEFNIPMYTVIGQHDMIMRNFQHLNRTGTYLLESSGAAHILGLDGKPAIVKEGTEEVYLHGLSFEQDFCLPAPVEGKANLLVAHAAVGTRQLYPGQEKDGTREFIRNNPGYDAILVGDQHYSFIDEYKGCKIYNTGCVIRKTILEHELTHEPCIFIYDTETKEAEKVLLDFKPWQKVFHIPDKKSKDESKLQEFLDSIKGDKKVQVSFIDNLRAYYDKNKVSGNIKSLVASAMERAGMDDKELKEVKDGS